MTVSNKVALYPMVPAAGVFLYGIASIFLYQTTIEARVSIFSSVATSVTVLFLISERLRDSALRKLDYLNKRALSPALRASRGTIQGISGEQAKIFSLSSELLNRHGRFLRWKLYPTNLIATLDRASKIVSAYEKTWQIVLDLGYTAMGASAFNIWALLKGLGFEVMGNYDESNLSPMKQFYEGLKTTDPELAKRLPIEGREVLKLKAEIVKKLEDFFAENQLDEARDTSAYPSIYGWSTGIPY